MTVEGQPVPPPESRPAGIKGHLRWMNDILVDYIPARTRYAIGGVAVGATSSLVLSSEIASVVTVLTALVGFGIGAAKDIKSRYPY